MVTKKITSLQHPLVKHWAELRKKKTYRDQHQKILITGEKLISELSVETLITLKPCSLPCKNHFLVTEPILKKITNLSCPDGFAAEIDQPQPVDLKGKKRLLILDQISDPGNLGTLMRTALALNWEGVILTPGTVDLFNDKVLRAARGAHFHLPYAYLPHEKIPSLSLNLYTADLQGEPLENKSFKPPIGLILSHEGKGVSSWSEKISKKVTIPMHPCVESLNVAASGAILLYEMRQI